jgi:uncharacterized protein (DUF1810 family)
LNLDRFITAQAPVYAQALAELRAGQKQTHWMWFVFPQMMGLGQSSASRAYGIQSLNEARSYLAHPVLGTRLRECCQAVMNVRGKSAHDIFGTPDDVKFRSSLTMFTEAAPQELMFFNLLEKYFDGEPDEATLELLTYEE